MGVYLKALRFYKAQSQISFVCGLKGCTTNGHNLLHAIVKLYSGNFCCDVSALVTAHETIHAFLNVLCLLLSNHIENINLPSAVNY